MSTCALLESKKINLTDTTMVDISDEEIASYCQKCHRHGCPLEDLEGRTFWYKMVVYPEVDEVFQCRKCGEITTLTFRNGKMDITRKFEQVGDKIYHISNCGECKRIG